MFKNKNKLFKHIFKIIDPKTDLCGTLRNNSFHELKVLLIVTLCFLLFMQLKINLSASLINLQALSFLLKIHNLLCHMRWIDSSL